MDIRQLVETDHANIRQLVMQISRASESGPNNRRKLLADLKQELTRHGSVMDKVLNPVLAGDGSARQRLTEAHAQHQAVIAKLKEVRSADAAGWARKLDDLTVKIDRMFDSHDQLIATARMRLAPDRADALAHDYRRAKIRSLRFSPYYWRRPVSAILGGAVSIAAIALAAAAWRRRQAPHTTRFRATRYQGAGRPDIRRGQQPAWSG